MTTRTTLAQMKRAGISNRTIRSRRHILFGALLAGAVLLFLAMTSRDGARAHVATSTASGFEITSPTAGSVVPCGQPITVTWTGGNPTDMVNVVLIDVQNFQVYQGFGVEPNTGSRVVTIGPGSCGRTSQFYVEDDPRTTWTYGPVFTVSAGSTCTAPPANMVSWWPGDGNANDIQGNNNGALQNGATFAPGKVGKAFSFDGGDDAVEVQPNSNLNLTAALSIDAWVNPSDISNDRGIVEKTVGGGVNTQYLLFLQGGSVVFRLIKVPGVEHATLVSDVLVPLNTWTHIAATWDGATMKLFVNGVQQSGMFPLTGTINGGVGPTFIGKGGSNINHFAGLIDEVEIFDRALSSAEISAIYLADSAGKCKPAPTPTPTPSPTPTPTCGSTYNAANDFSKTSNPTGVWSYGWESSLGGAFTLNASERMIFSGVDTWEGPDACGGPENYPLVHFNDTGSLLGYASGIFQPPDMLNLIPSCTGKFSVVRFTAPANGSFSVTGVFQGIDIRNTTSDVHVLRNSNNNLFSGNINGYGNQQPFNLITNLLAGETLDFVVGFGSNATHNADSTGLALTITDCAPTATTVPMFASSALDELYVYAVSPTSSSLQTVYSGSTLHEPIGIAVGSSGDLFVINSGEPEAVGSGSVDRFTVNGYNLTLQNTFGSGQLSDPFWADFRGNELLIAQAQSNNVGRFTIATDGSAIFNGTFGSFQNPNARGLAVGGDGAVFVSECCGTERVSRFVASGSTFVLASTFQTSDFHSIHGIALSPSGELFVASPLSNTVVRVKIAADGTMTENGVISDAALNRPQGVGFSPWGELFVANTPNEPTGSIVRFRFDAAGNAIQNGVISTPRPVEDVKFSRAADTTPPITSCPSPVTASADVNCQAQVPDVRSAVTASDDSGRPVTLSQTPAAGTLVGLGATTITVTATDGSNNFSSCTTTLTVTDVTPPTITITSPSNGATYLVNQSVASGYGCTDCGGVASCLGPVASGSNINTASAGMKTFTVSARDNAGNNATPQSVNYLITYGIRVLFDQTKAAKSGSTIPIKVQLVDANGNNVSTSVVVVHAVNVVQISSSASVLLDDAGQANPDFDFRYDSTLGGYIFNLKTTGYGTGTYVLTYSVTGDPINHKVQFQVRQ